MASISQKDKFVLAIKIGCRNLVQNLEKFLISLDKTIYLKERNLHMGFFLRVIFSIFRVGLISGIGYRWIFPEDIFSRILVLSRFLQILIFLWFILQLDVCESQNSCSNFSICQIALFGYKRYNVRLFDIL